MRILLFLAALLLAYAPLSARETPIIGPAPDWVVAVEPPAEQTEATRGQAAAVRLLDLQWRFDEAGTHIHARSLVKVGSSDALASLGTVAAQWHPGIQTLTVHRVALHRGGERIDLLARGTGFTVLRREGGLERAMLDGLLTASLQIPDLRVGDSVEVAITVTTLNPLLAGRGEGFLPVAAPFSADRFHFAVSWPNGRQMRWRAGEAFPRLRETRRGGFTWVTFDETGYSAQVLPDGAPARILDSFAFQVSDFESWTSLSSLFGRVYDDAARLAEDSPLRAEVERIAAISDDPVRRAEAALALVQNEVRYLFDGTGLGGYMPASADEVWAVRFGDCKGKTALLIALLRELGIEAEPALVATARGDGTDAALPMPARFDHVLARARIGERTYWLDGTRTGDSSLSRIEAPQMKWALPLIVAGSDLQPLPPSEPQRPTTELSLEYDARQGIHVPSGARAELVFRGDDAIALFREMEFMSAADRQSALRAYWEQSFENLEVENADYAFDPATGELRYSMAGSIRLNWGSTGHNPPRRLELSRARLGYNFTPQRRPGPWADAPVAVASTYYSTRYSILLPNQGSGFVLDGEQVDETIGPAHYRRDSRLRGGRVEVEAVTRVSAGEIGYEEARTTDRTSDGLFAKRLYVRVPLTYQFTETERSVLAGHGAEGASMLAEIDAMQAIHPAMERGDLPGALAQLTALIDRGGPSVSLLLFRSQLRSETGDHDGAEADLDAALAMEPTNISAMTLRAERLAAAGRSEDAAIILDRLILTAPSHPAAYFKRAELRAVAGRIDAAVADLEIGLRLEPENVPGWIQLVAVHSDNGRLEQALAASERLVALFPDDSTAHALHGNVLAVLEREEEAKEALERSLALEETGNVYATRANYDLSGGPEQRLADLVAIVRLEPERRLPQRALRAVIGLDGAYERLASAYEEQLRAHPNPRALEPALAVLYSAAERHEEHMALLNRQIAAEPRSARLLNERCWSRATRGVELEEALADCDAAIALSRSAAHLDSRALVHLRRGDLPAAVADYDAALALNPRLSLSLYGRGIAKLRQGDRAAGETDLATARDIRRDVGEEFARYNVEP